MNHAENALLKEKTEMNEFQTKGNFKVAGNDGKSQVTFMQLADQKQTDFSVINQKGYTLEEVKND